MALQMVLLSATTQALMLAAAADGGPACEALLAGAATLELADALGRTALMFAAGNDACAALAALLEAGASVSCQVICNIFQPALGWGIGNAHI